jgi:hypothetical protein
MPRRAKTLLACLPDIADCEGLFPAVKILHLDFKTKIVLVGLPLFSGKNNGQILQGGWEGRYFFPKASPKRQKKTGHWTFGGKVAKCLGTLIRAMSLRKIKKYHAVSLHTCLLHLSSMKLCWIPPPQTLTVAHTH